ncbi:hypothetical protein BST81_16590 [Leptolyngbya sp. 'hensonii']|uniref:5'-methylthioadenosine/S-adenosylhomocysteine nucleosidase family protein n=1 Tax=Leptolyngbya sp. 'hensonii' TaxID=1922337 RepID=UPI00094F619C|nr:5'-methylthioadenosine/S-adenosylhomocysteine nucleosidase [Leptolyngbya sp. 'hensonii']OLP17410.1 hypothetical protein BST81_16590 [Leptolyngbya sp. 'hensonii']
MSGNLRQSIAQSGSIRQTGALPTAIALAEDPKQPATAVYKRLEAGQAIPPCVVILTALPEEFLAVEEHVVDRYEVQHPDGTVYECGRFKLGGWTVAIGETGQGNVNAADETQRAIVHFKPDVVLFVGVAGGRKDVMLGDVVAAEKVYNYESGRDEDIFKPRPEARRSSYPLEQRARAVARDWLRRKKEPGNESLPRAFVGAIAAGESVVASTDSATEKLLQRNYGDALAVEKEGYGFLEAARRSRGVSAMVIRGISDLLDGKAEADAKGGQETAARHASRFAFELLAKLAGDDLSNPVETYQTTAQVALDSTLPDGMISLNVQALMEDDQYYIHAHHGKRTFANRGQFDRSLMTLHQQIESNLAADNLLSAIDDCNVGISNSVDCLAGQLLAWLHQQNDSPDRIPCLMIDDRTECEILWELLESGQKPVGVAFQTVRQRQMEAEATSVNSCCGGGVLVYAHAKYEGWQRYQRQQFTVFQEFLSQMQKPATEFGLVFIDGFSVEEPLKHSPIAYIKRSKLFRGGTSIVFISGQLDLDASIGLTHRMLLTNFLEHGAKGIVGTLWRVDRARAKAVVEQFSDEHRQHPEWTVPEILRRLREQVWGALEHEVNEETCAAYLATFLHVYYGNPMTVLQLTSAEGESND